MSETRFTDVVIPEVYQGYRSINNMEKTAFWVSGVVVNSPELNRLATGNESNTVNLPFWKDLDPNEEPNYPNDDSADKLVPTKVTADKMLARKSWLAKGYSAMDMVAEVAGSDPMTHIASRFNTYWARQNQRRLIASARGILAGNIANNSGDMRVDISALSGDAAKFGSAAYVDAAYTLGDNVDALKVVAVHSFIASRIAKNDDIEAVKDSTGQIVYYAYKGHRLVVDDTLPVTGTDADRVFTSIMFGEGAFGYGQTNGSAAVVRDELAGDGGGQETIIERNSIVLHPHGFSWVEGTLTENSPKLSDLATSTHWVRKVERKAVPIAFLLSKA